MSNFIPYCKIKPNNDKKKHPWFNIEIKQALKERNNLHQHMRSLLSSENIRVYNHNVSKRELSKVSKSNGATKKASQLKAKIMPKYFFMHK